MKPEAKHEWRAVDGGPAATICHMWCANCGTLWAVCDPYDAARTNRYFVPGWAFEKDGSTRPHGGLTEEPDCPPGAVSVEVTVSDAPPPDPPRQVAAGPHARRERTETQTGRAAKGR
jgi:hypothetical protein